MAHLLLVTCNACGAESEQIDGPLMMGFNPRCEHCGETKFVPMEDDNVGNPPDIDPVSEEATRLRYERLSGIAGPCACGGRFRQDAPVRCRSCRSTDVTSVVTGSAD